MTAKVNTTKIRVKDLEKSLHFYTQLLCMELLKKELSSDGSLKSATVGHSNEDFKIFFELYYNNKGAKSYVPRLASRKVLEVDNFKVIWDKIKESGARTTPRYGEPKQGGVVDDPDGNAILLVDRDSYR